MTRIYDDPEVFATTAIAGFSSIYARHVRPVTGGVLRSTATPEGKVALVVGGGSGHYPAFAGFVGPGMADADMQHFMDEVLADIDGWAE